MTQTNVKPADGKLGIMVVGCGAVSTTFMVGVLMARRGLTKPVGSMTQYDKIRVGKGDDKKYLKYEDIVPMAKLDDIVFGTWDVYPQNAFQAAMYAEVLKEKDILPVKDELEQIVVGCLHTEGKTCNAFLSEKLHGVEADGVGIAFHSYLRVKANIAVELESVQYFDNAVSPVEAGVPPPK